jgi:hypothetical protein
MEEECPMLIRGAELLHRPCTKSRWIRVYLGSRPILVSRFDVQYTVQLSSLFSGTKIV